MTSHYQIFLWTSIICTVLRRQAQSRRFWETAKDRWLPRNFKWGTQSLDYWCRGIKKNTGLIRKRGGRENDFFKKECRQCEYSESCLPFFFFLMIMWQLEKSWSEHFAVENPPGYQRFSSTPWEPSHGVELTCCPSNIHKYPSIWTSHPYHFPLRISQWNWKPWNGCNHLGRKYIQRGTEARSGV